MVAAVQSVILLSQGCLYYTPEGIFLSTASLPISKSLKSGKTGLAPISQPRRGRARLGARSFLGPRASPVPSPCGGRLRAFKRTARAGRGSPGRVPSRLRARPRPILVSALASFSRGLACARPSPPSSPAPRAAPWAPGCRAPRAVPWPPCGGAWALSRGSRLPGLSGLGPLGCGPFRAPRGPRALFWGGGLAAGGSACGPGFGLGGFRWLCVPGLRSVPPPRPLPRRLRRVPGCVGRGRGFWRSRAALPRWAGSVHRPPHSIVTKGGR